MERYLSLERLATYLDAEWSKELFCAAESEFNHPERPLDPRLWLSQSFYKNVVSFARQWVPGAEGMRYADIGAATGRMILEWSLAYEQVGEMVWVEPSPLFAQWASMLLLNPDAVEQVPVVGDLDTLIWVPFSAQARQRFPTRQLKVLQECLSFCNVKVREIPRSDNYFDALTCLNLVDRHEDPLGLVEHLWRLLKPGGFLLLSSPFDWRESYTPKKAWVNDLCALLPPEKWRVLATCDEFYDIRHSSRYVVRHLSQVVAAQKI